MAEAAFWPGLSHRASLAFETYIRAMTSRPRSLLRQSTIPLLGALLLVPGAALADQSQAPAPEVGAAAATPTDPTTLPPGAPGPSAPGSTATTATPTVPPPDSAGTSTKGAPGPHTSTTPSVSLSAPALPVQAGQPFDVSGTATDVLGPITVSLSGAPLATAALQADGSWSARIRVEGPGKLSATADGVQSHEVPITVAPGLALASRVRAVLLRDAVVRARVTPASLRATAEVMVVPSQGKRLRTTATVRDGVLQAKFPVKFLGRADVSVRIPATGGYQAVAASTTLVVEAPRLTQGDRHAAVKPMLKRLRSLGFHIPGLSTKYSKSVSEVVLAFRKSQRMDRSYNVDRSVWRMLLSAKSMRAKYRWSGTHLEIDKTRQILMVVRDGKVLGTLHVSTGATGNTPEGTYGIYQRGGSYLYRFMAFVGNFGIHGYVPVPPYPASHGCVREPMWAADWTWSQTSYGTRVVVYR